MAEEWRERRQERLLAERDLVQADLDAMRIQIKVARPLPEVVRDFRARELALVDRIERINVELSSAVWSDEAAEQVDARRITDTILSRRAARAAAKAAARLTPMAALRILERRLVP